MKRKARLCLAVLAACAALLLFSGCGAGGAGASGGSTGYGTNRRTAPEGKVNVTFATVTNENHIDVRYYRDAAKQEQIDIETVHLFDSGAVIYAQYKVLGNCYLDGFYYRTYHDITGNAESKVGRLEAQTVPEAAELDWVMEKLTLPESFSGDISIEPHGNYAPVRLRLQIQERNEAKASGIWMVDSARNGSWKHISTTGSGVSIHGRDRHRRSVREGLFKVNDYAGLRHCRHRHPKAKPFQAAAPQSAGVAPGPARIRV